jgi:hypothetical protein
LHVFDPATGHNLTLASAAPGASDELEQKADATFERERSDTRPADATTAGSASDRIEGTERPTDTTP